MVLEVRSMIIGAGGKCDVAASSGVGLMGRGMAVKGSFGSAVSVVRKPRSLMVNFCGFTTCSGSGMCRWD